ncbi:MAG: hypothetical protein ABEJ44_02965 [Halanaeroarchaeum sp.]
MEPVTSDLETDQRPPLSIPFAFFATGAVLLLIGGGIAGIAPFFLPIRASDSGTIHLLMAGWVGMTIMGAMIQFVPVWSGTALHSERLAVYSLWMVLVGVAGTVGVFLFRAYGSFLLPATVLLGGFWTFAYLVGRTLPPIRSMDVTEGHFLLALVNVVLGTTMGWLLAMDVEYDVLAFLPVDSGNLLVAHLTMTIFGFVLVTIVGALYQLAPMFTQFDSNGVDATLVQVEMVSLPAGVYSLATGRLFDVGVLAQGGATMIVAGVVCVAIFLFRHLWGARVETNPLLRRYWLVAGSLFGWAILTVPSWLIDPTSYFVRFGSQRATHLLFIGVFTFTILGTFYHVVPFIVWFEEYSDRLGYEQVPMIDDMYDGRIAAVEFWFLAGGLAILWLGELVVAPTIVLMIGGNLLGVGVILFAINMGLVVWRHRPGTVREVFLTIRGTVQ